MIQSEEEKNSLPKQRGKGVSGLFRFFNKYMLVIIAIVLLGYFYCYPDVLNKVWTDMRSYSGDTASKITFESLFQATLFLLCASYIVSRFKKIIDNYILARFSLDTGIKHTIVTLINYCIWIFIILISLSILGIQLKNLAILFGALSVGIGFGLQNVVNNFVSGIIILFERPIKEGDWVVINGQEGIVKSIRIRATELETFSGADILIPNAEILSGNVVNWTHSNMDARVEVPVGVAYETDLKKAKEILLKIAKNDKRIAKDPPPYVWITAFADSAINMELRAYTQDVMSKGSIKSDLMFKIIDEFRKNKIEIPFPQQVVYLKNEESNH